MTRRFKSKTFWIAVISLNLIPLVAHGDDGKCTPELAKTNHACAHQLAQAAADAAIKSLQEVGRQESGDMSKKGGDVTPLPVNPVNHKSKANQDQSQDQTQAPSRGKKSKGTKHKASKPRLTFNDNTNDGKYTECAKATRSGDKPWTRSAAGKAPIFTKDGHHQTYRGEDLVTKCEDYHDKKGDGTPNPALQPKPEPVVEAKAPVEEPSPGHDLSYDDAIKGSIRGLSKIDPQDKVYGAVQITGKVFADCASMLTVNQVTLDDRNSNDPSCKGFAGGYELTIAEGYDTCLKKHADDKGQLAECTTYKGPNQCIDISTQSGALLNLSQVKRTGKIGIIADNPNAGIDKKYSCSSFPNDMLAHKSPDEWENEVKQEQSTQLQVRVNVDIQHLKCMPDTADNMPLVKGYCADLGIALMDYMDDSARAVYARECSVQKFSDRAKNAERAAFAQLKKKAAAGSDDDDETFDSLVQWANDHTDQCNQPDVLDSLVAILDRKANAQGSRAARGTMPDLMGNASGTFKTIDGMINQAREDAPCLDEFNALTALQGKYEAQGAEKLCEASIRMTGTPYTLECQAAKATATQDTMMDAESICSAEGMQLGGACMAVRSNLMNAVSADSQAWGKELRQKQQMQQLLAMSQAGTQPQQQAGIVPSNYPMPGAPSLPPGLSLQSPGGYNLGWGYGSGNGIRQFTN
jgi:hypothetical protein